MPHSDPASPDILWTPSDTAIEETNLAHYNRWLAEKKGLVFDRYEDLWRWSVTDLSGFWSSIADYFDVRFHSQPVEYFREKPDVRWFFGSTLNYAEHVLRNSGKPDAAAILFVDEWGHSLEISRAELRDQTVRLAASFRRLGVKCGDRVAGFLPNIPETVVAFLAAVSIGAIWTNCPLELGSPAVLDRLTQIKPKLLLASLEYSYGGKKIDRQETVVEIVAGLPELEHLVVVGKPRELAVSCVQYEWAELLKSDASGHYFEPVPFDHPLWILYSSGTTGLPKGIVHGHGGILLEHLKTLSLHLDLKPRDRFFWFTSAGWMMWNLLVSGLLLPGVTIVLYDGSPKYPNLGRLWQLAEEACLTYFGASAPYFAACKKEGLAPKEKYSLEKLRGIGSTGAPLSGDLFDWIYANVKQEVHLGSVSGGTDVCTAFVLSNPQLPVRRGKIQCLALGAKIEAWNEAGQSVLGEVGELVLSAPYPSMPVYLWNDADGVRLRASYYDKFPGVWAHGDWIVLDAPSGPCEIHGRSDATLNRGGVRMGTAEFYSILEGMPEVEEALVIDLADRLILFVTTPGGRELEPAAEERIRSELKVKITPRHVPDVILRVPEIPRTLNGKKLEIPVKRILSGVPMHQAVNRATVSNPEALDYFAQLHL